MSDPLAERVGRLEDVIILLLSDDFWAKVAPMSKTRREEHLDPLRRAFIGNSLTLSGATDIERQIEAFLAQGGAGKITIIEVDKDAPLPEGKVIDSIETGRGGGITFISMGGKDKKP